MEQESISAEIQRWVSLTHGWFTSRDCDQELGIITKEDKHARRQTLYRLVQDGTIERHPDQQGKFRLPSTQITKMDLSKSVGPGEKIKLPFEIHKFFKTYPGNIIVLAGVTSSGKTAFLLNTVVLNMGLWKIHYFNSEMGEEELIDRVRQFDDVTPEDWIESVNFYSCSSDWARVIVPGRGNLNIIDYMEIHDKHYLVGQWIKDIHDKLDGALAIIAIQKDPYKDWGTGGMVTEQKARLYLTMKRGELTIKKCKNRRDKFQNPDGFKINFKLVGGSLFIPQDAWGPPEGEDWNG